MMDALTLLFVLSLGRVTMAYYSARVPANAVDERLDRALHPTTILQALLEQALERGIPHLEGQLN